MNKLFISTALAGSLLLGGCATTSPGIDPITGNPIATEIANIQATAIQVCSFEPTAETVAAILATFVPGAAPVSAVVEQVARAICGAVTAKSLRVGKTAMVNGVVVSGQFVVRKSARRGVPMVNGVVINGQFVPK